MKNKGLLSALRLILEALSADENIDTWEESDEKKFIGDRVTCNITLINSEPITTPHVVKEYDVSISQLITEEFLATQFIVLEEDRKETTKCDLCDEDHSLDIVIEYEGEKLLCDSTLFKIVDHENIINISDQS